jgi:hypothetical protein
MALKSPKQKGDRLEREVSVSLNERLGLDSRRTPMSGGGFNAPTQGDLTGTPLISVECKAVQALNIRDALNQARRAAGRDIPVVINRRDREVLDEAVVAIRYRDFLNFYAALLIVTGHRRANTDDPPPPLVSISLPPP